MGFVCIFVLARHAIVEELAGLGATVHTCARNGAELSRCLKSWEDDEESFRVTGSVCDVSSRSDREKLVDTVSSLFKGKLDILVSFDLNLLIIIVQHSVARR